MNYEEKSDHEINGLVLKAKGLPLTGNINELFIKVGEDLWQSFDPCNNPSDSMPIIADNKISISNNIIRIDAHSLVYDKKFDNGFKMFRHYGAITDTSLKAYLRAGLIVFLMMKDAENDKQR